MSFFIKPANDRDAPIITAILDKVTEALHQKGIMQWSVPWGVREIVQEIACQHVFTLQSDKIIGTFSLKNIENSPCPQIERGSLYLYRIAILPVYQGKNLGERIVKYACAVADAAGKTLTLDCWAGNRNLRRFYAQYFDYCGYFDENNYKISVFKH